MDTVKIIAFFGPAIYVVIEAIKIFVPEINARRLSRSLSVLVAITCGGLLLYLGEEAFTDLMTQVMYIGAFVYSIASGLHKLQK